MRKYKIVSRNREGGASIPKSTLNYLVSDVRWVDDHWAVFVDVDHNHVDALRALCESIGDELIEDTSEGN